jgi:hypothetical protein
MPLSPNEIKSRAMAFSKDFAQTDNEDADAKTFWDRFFDVFGVSRSRIASFEKRVKKLDGKDGYIDLLWKGKLLIEHKSRGKNLDRAYSQALEYFPGLKEEELPRIIVVSDFARFRVYDLEADTQVEFTLKDLHKNVRLFGFIAGYQIHTFREQDPVNIKAAERMGRLHDQMKAVGYDGHALELYLVRLLFCMFAEDTGIFTLQQFQDYLEQRTSTDGSDLGDRLATLFHVLNTPVASRLKNLDEQLATFPYINGKLFAEQLPPAGFDSAMRKALLECCFLDWSRISPAIFGSLFQSIMDKEARRNLGAHYTSEANIRKLLGPLFLDELRAEFERVKTNRNKLFEFHKKLRRLTFLDPACGCGNFLIIAYRELRLLELDVLRASRSDTQMVLDVQALISVNVDQFYGIELAEFPAQIAQVALWLMDHQMNLLVSEEFGMYFARIPLQASANIVHGNALQLDWEAVVVKERLTYILGNPPFVGAKFLDESQRVDVNAVFGDIKNAGLLDLVAAWYVKAARMAKGTAIRCAFVSTNSICQGEQVGALWSYMLAQGVQIHFAHRTFAWNNEAKGKAAVHCVIVGFGFGIVAQKVLFDYESIKGEALAHVVQNINPYLVDAPNVVLQNRSKPLCNVPEIGIGNQPIDDGNYLFTPEEKDAFVAAEPQSAPYFHRWLGADEFLNGYHRYCLWLGHCPPQVLRSMPMALQRIDAVRKFRLASKRPSTVKLASTPSRFLVERFPKKTYLIIPEVSSERRLYLPIGFETPDTLCSNLVKMVPDASLYHFGVLSSLLHNAWMRSVAGRLKSDYRYSAGIVYNNFPWPSKPSEKQVATIEAAAKRVLDTRLAYPDASLASLYDPLSMPSDLLKAHQALDKAVDATYGKKSFASEAERVAFLFGLLG